jgi:dienelactone hydrolase
MRALRLSLVSLFVSLCLLPSAWAQVLVEQEVFLNTRVSGALVRLEAFIVKMKDAPSQRLPIALITHGKPPSEGRVSDMRARLYAPQARDFARRGYLAVVVMRRGFGRSDGPSPVGVTCGSEDFGRNFEAAADDIESALAIIAQRSDADPDRIVAIGASAGGAAVLTLAARNPKGLRGVINVSGGLQIDNCSKDQLLIEPIAASGAKARVKTLWIYAENDNLFPPAIVDKMHEAWLARGGDVRRVRLPAQSSNGHTIFNTLTGRRAWLTEADAFLRDTGLPTWTQAHVRELLKDLKFKPEQGAGAERYLTAPGEKALARSKTSNRTSFQFGGPDLAQAHQRALQQCESREPKETCEIVAENNVLLSTGRWLLAPASERSETHQSSD